ncbi:MAG: cupin domain-containing protein [Halovenus sp.]
MSVPSNPAGTSDAPSRAGPARVTRPLGRELATDHVNVNYFELAPGETFAFGYHRHPEQEEVFYVLEGTATFETELRTPCPDCGTRTPARIDRADDTDALVTVCEDCGVEADRYA